MTTNLILDFGKPVSITSLFNMAYKSLFLTILFSSIHLACGIPLTLTHNSAYRALFNIFLIFSCVSTANRLKKQSKIPQTSSSKTTKQMTTADKQHVRQWAGELHCFVKSIQFSFCFCSDEINCWNIYIESPQKVTSQTVGSSAFNVSRNLSCVFICLENICKLLIKLLNKGWNFRWFSTF